MRSSALARNTTHSRIDKPRVKINLKILDDIKAEFRGTKKYIEKRLEEECSKENISMDEVIFFLHTRKQRVSTEKNLFYFVMLYFKAGMFDFVRIAFTKYVNRCSAELNPLSHDIYLHVIWI